MHELLVAWYSGHVISRLFKILGKDRGKNRSVERDGKKKQINCTTQGTSHHTCSTKVRSDLGRPNHLRSSQRLRILPYSDPCNFDTYTQRPHVQPSHTHHLRLRRHIHLCPRTNRILALPKTRDSLLLRIKLQPGLAIKRIRAATGHTLLIAGEAEHGQRDGDGDVDADLAGLELLLEAGGRRAGGGEDGDAVAVFVGVDQVDGFVEGVDVEADEDGAEDFFLVAAAKKKVR